jgi:type III pantothenate kinase
MNLLIDMGNTRLKWATCNPLDMVIGSSIPNAEINPNALIQLWQTTPSPEHIVISCVSANRLFDLVVSAINKLWPGSAILRAKSMASALGVVNAYPEPENLGIDRWLGMVASFYRYRKAFCLVGCGTAITVDVVDDSGKHLGGLISPGLRLMKAALANNTANLGLDETIYSFGLAKNTAAAIHNGTLSAACGLIERTLINLPDNLQLILTGGDADLIAIHLAKSARIEPDLVLRGLALTLQELQ